ncbi:MAG: hypothetical protein ACI8UO_006369 [Verrucomicrobiales bacterium]|jgi:hypothetical protein
MRNANEIPLDRFRNLLAQQAEEFEGASGDLCCRDLADYRLIPNLCLPVQREIVRWENGEGIALGHTPLLCDLAEPKTHNPEDLWRSGRDLVSQLALLATETRYDSDYHWGIFFACTEARFQYFTSLWRNRLPADYPLHPGTLSFVVQQDRQEDPESFDWDKVVIQTFEPIDVCAHLIGNIPVRADGSLSHAWAA